MRISVGDKSVFTPIKPMDPRKEGLMVESSPSISKASIQLSRETGKPLTMIPRMDYDSQGIITIIPSYVDSSISDDDLCHMENYIHPNTDLIATPRWDGIIRKNNGETLLDDLWSATKRYLEEVRRINGKPILGNIPLNRPQKVIDSLLNHYLREGITSFVFDFEGCQAPTRWPALRGVNKILSDAGAMDESILYSTNMRRSHDYQIQKPADDFLMFMKGMDVLGNYHLRGGGGNPHVVKVFDQTSWTYVNQFLAEQKSSDVKRDNILKINHEADAVKMLIQETGTAIKLAKPKTGATEYISGLQQTTLDFKGLSWID